MALFIKLFFFISIQQGTEQDNVVIHRSSTTFQLSKTLTARNYIALRKVTLPHIPINFSYVEFTLVMERLPEYYLYTMGLPSTIVTILALFALLLPPDCGEKLSFIVSLLLGLSVFQLVVADHLPENSRDKQPLLMAYLSLNFVMVGLTLFLTLVTININSSKCKITNRRLRRILLEIPSRLLCANRYITDKECYEQNHNLEPNSTRQQAKESEGNVENTVSMWFSSNEKQVSFQIATF